MKTGVDCAYVIKAKCGKKTIYFDYQEYGWTTLVFCTKFAVYSKAKEVRDTLRKNNSSCLKGVEITKCKLYEVGI